MLRRSRFPLALIASRRRGTKSSKAGKSWRTAGACPCDQVSATWFAAPKAGCGSAGGRLRAAESLNRRRRGFIDAMLRCVRADPAGKATEWPHEEKMQVCRAAPVSSIALARCRLR
jgi:hypothetical protein